MLCEIACCTCTTVWANKEGRKETIPYIYDTLSEETATNTIAVHLDFNNL